MENINAFFDEYNKKIVDAVNIKMKELYITQKQLSELSNISQPTLSKLLSGKSKFTVEQIARISISLKIDVSEFVSFKKMDVDFNNNVYSTRFIPENDSLVCDVTRSAFKGYVDNKYYIYFYSTISSESKLIHGEFTLFNSDKNRCKIALKIYTGKIDVSGKKITKNYTGDMIISIPLSSCYCILINQEIGEMCFLTFHHMFLFSQNMICRMGAVLTTSSGENRRPTLHRMIISKTEFDLNKNSEDLSFLRGQLKLNDSKIVISKSVFEKLINDDKIKSRDDIMNFLNKFCFLSVKEEYYTIDESKLLDSTIPVLTKVQGISLLREYSTTYKYNKISTKTDEFLFEYISNKKISE